ncbi:MAG: TetR/AcrR family transcriptional regulator [Boseongicola sp.]|nr:TetR/AcrR family transcriptional regulator [Boseongicola sp.]NNL72226.1 TetR/AcrR family transcriptional regulator [Silicimonas sp.]
MARDTAKRREDLRDKLLDIAEAEIRQSGLASLRARALAEKAGCAVGAIYNVFDDMTGLMLAVNGRTFRRMGTFVAGTMKDHPDAAPTETLITIAKAYLAFAIENPNLWRALFEVEMSTDGDVPAWYLDELGRLFSIISSPIAELKPDASAAEVDLMTRTLFSSVHGIVLLGLERRISGVPRERMEDMIEYLLQSVTT